MICMEKGKKHGAVYVTTSDARTYSFEKAYVYKFENELYVEEDKGLNIFNMNYVTKVGMYGETE